MSFLHPWLLLGALGAAVPVLLHFFGRRRARRVPFSSLMLIQQAQRERSALMRVRQLLLMVLRALLILLLALAAAQPVLPVRARPGDALIVLDDTPSVPAMDALGLFRGAGGEPRAAAAAAARTVSSRARAMLLSELAYPDNASTPAGDRGCYRALDNAPLLADPAATGGLGEGASVVFFTDLQATGWLTPAPLPPQRHVVVVDCGHDTPNRSLLGLEPREPAVIAGRPAELVITGRAATGPPGPVPVRVLADGREVAAVTLHLGPEPSQAVCEWRPDGAGVKRLEAMLPDDAMPEDNVCHAAVAVRQRLRVLILGAGPAARLMALALAPAAKSPVQVETATALPAAPDVDAIIVAQPPTPAELQQLKQAAAMRVGLIVLVPRVPLGALRDLTGDAELALRPARPGPLHLGDFDVFRPPLRAFATPQAGDLKQPEFRQVPELVVRPTQWHIAARFEDGSVAVATRQRVLLLALPLDAPQTNLPQQPVFVPLLHRLVGFVARSAAPDFGRVLVGQPLGGTVSLADRAGSAPQSAGLAGAPEVPGFYRVASSGSDGQREALVAANLDPAEGDLRRTTVARVRECLGDRATVIRPGADGRVVLPRRTGTGLRLSGPLLAAALLLVLFEFALAQGLRLPSFRRRGEV